MLKSRSTSEVMAMRISEYHDMTFSWLMVYIIAMYCVIFLIEM